MTEGLLKLGEILLSTSQRRLETVANNISNSATPGFKAERLYEQVLAGEASANGAAISPERRISVATDFSQASLQQTGAPFDLALAGAGFFALRDGEEIAYVRSAHFERDRDGRIVDQTGRTLQSQSGGDVIVQGAAPEILSDGTVVEDGAPIARIGVFAARADVARDNGAFVADADQLRPIDEPIVRQGMIESSNVDTAEEMLQMMTAVRQAETGARIVQAYDTLIGQAITTLRAPR